MKKQLSAITTYRTGIGFKPEIPKNEIIDEMMASPIITAKSGRLGFGFQKLLLSRTARIVNFRRTIACQMRRCVKIQNRNYIKPENLESEFAILLGFEPVSAFKEKNRVYLTKWLMLRF